MRKDVATEDIRQMYLKGMSCFEIAEIFAMAEQSIRSRLYRIGMKLRGRGKSIALAAKRGRGYSSYNYRGENSNSWKGGIHYCQGYRMIYMPEHPRAIHRPYVREHIVVWEKTHNKYLPLDWNVHHLNGIRDDNRPENLVAMSRSGHTQLEQSQHYKKRIIILEKEIESLKKQLEPLIEEGR